ncbi:MAG: T9SS type A sorting domain-containing protein [Mucilaginibacter sp.]
MTSPANGATYFGTPATIAISAAAVAYGGKIKTVKFYNGTKLIHTEENPPYLWTWKNVQEGIYKIMAKTMDTYGRENVSPTITITVSAAKCDSASKPTFSYSFNGTAVANINNGVRDPGEFASVTLCNGGQYTQSGFVSSDPANLYQLIYGSGGNNTLLFNGAVRKSRVLTTAQFAGLQHTWTVSLLNPDMPGFGQQTITPFKDLNHNGRLDAGDCAGDPIVESYGLGTCTTSGNLLSTVPADKKPGIYGVTTLQLLPNPARSVLNISITGVQQNKPTTISVISASGVIIKTLQAKSSAQTIPLNVSSLKSGMYVIKIISEGKVIYKPFVKM